jgi:hypothetical protein
LALRLGHRRNRLCHAGGLPVGVRRLLLVVRCSLGGGAVRGAIRILQLRPPGKTF